MIRLKSWISILLKVAVWLIIWKRRERWGLEYVLMQIIVLVVIDITGVICKKRSDRPPTKHIAFCYLKRIKR